MSARGLVITLLVIYVGPAFTQPSQPTSTAQLKAFTELLLPHALELSANLSVDAEAHQGRKLQQATLPDGSLCCPTKPVLTAVPPIPPNDGVLTYPQYMNARCQFNIVGNNQTVNGIVSASIVCETADKTDVLMYMGSELLKFAANFKGVYAVGATPGTITIDPNSLFLVQAGGIEIYGSTFSNIAVGKDYPLITFTSGTSPVLVTGSTFTDITTCVGDVTGSTMCLPAIASTDFTTYMQIVNTNFEACRCFNQEICHSGAVYVTDRSSAILRGVHIDGSIGHFGGGLMVTDGASFKAFNSIFSNNAVPVYGSIGGAIWLSACQAYDPAYDQITGFGVIDGSFFASNGVIGTGGGVTVTDCPNFAVTNSIFFNNAGILVGGAIALRGSSPGASIGSSFFINNWAHTYFGATISQEPCAPGGATVTSCAFYNNAEGNPASSGGADGCDVPTTGNGNTDGLFTADQIAHFNSIVAGVGL